MTAIATAPSTALPVERRFPLNLRASIASIRDLYEQSKQARWDPGLLTDWAGLRAADFPAAVASAARELWSRRAWVEYTGLSETPALLIRFCLEADRESDPKYFLTVRNTEEAWHVECFHRLAESFGGYIDRPRDARWEAVFNQTQYRDALSAEKALDAHVAVHCALEDGLERELYDAYLANATQPVVRAVLEAVARDKRRHAEFGWLYLTDRAPRFTAEQREQVAQGVQRWQREVHEAGYLVASLNRGLFAQTDREGVAALAEAGLGAVTCEQEETIAADYMARATERLRELDLAGPR